MLAIQIIGAFNLPSIDSTKQNYYASVVFNDLEIHRTHISSEISNPMWHDVPEISIDNLRGKEKENNRPLFLEYLYIHIYTVSDKNSSEMIAETRILLSNLGQAQFYRLFKPETGNSVSLVSTSSSVSSSSNLGPSKEIGQLLIALTLSEDTLGEGRIVGYQSLHEEMSNKMIQYAPLFLNFDLSPLSLIGADPLPGPLVHEMILDRHETVEVEAFTGINSFGDKYRVVCRGILYLTELRLLFVATSITSSPSGLNFVDLPTVEQGDCRNESELLALRRASFHIPLSSIQDCRYLTIDTNTCAIQVTSRDAINSEFIIRKSVKRRKVIMRTTNTNGIIQKLPSGFFVPDCEPINEQQKKLNFRSYRSGIQTEDVSPNIWCTRLVEEIIWRIREDCVWIKWAKCFRATIQEVIQSYSITQYNYHNINNDGNNNKEYYRERQNIDAENEDGDDNNNDNNNNNSDDDFDNDEKGKGNILSNSNQWWRDCLSIPSVIQDYSRLEVEDGPWYISTNNINYELCDTYPQTLVFPTTISENDLIKASLERSRQRLPSLVWIHPVSRIPLCRSAQPLAGLSKAPEYDKKIFLAIQQNCPTGLPLRIADARPFINAQANAIQGKGYENVSFLGGSSVAQLYFLNIQNIHVMRECLQKLRDSYTTLQFDGSVGGLMSGQSSGGSTYDTIASDSTEEAVSKWLGHVSSVLKGAASIAESILLGHPILVHCSDGWDRTSQLTSLSQLLLDPYYRTIEGFLLLIEKEWVSFGHQFKHRLGKLTHKETSPVFLQFLDCVTQMLYQFPSEFEFSNGLIEVIAKCTYSGYFSTFRQDSEYLKNNELLTTISSESMNFTHEDLDYSSVYTYLRFLLHSSIGDLLINPYFCPPESTHKRVKYLRPRCSPSELILWQQGLIPRHMNRFSGFGGGGRGNLSRIECEALSSGTYTRLINYWNLHLNELPLICHTRINLLSSKHRGRLFHASLPYQIQRRKVRYSVLPNNTLHENEFFISTSSTSITTSSSSYCNVDTIYEYKIKKSIHKIQLLYRSKYILKQYILQLQNKIKQQIKLTTFEIKFNKILSNHFILEIIRLLIYLFLFNKIQLKENIQIIVKQQILTIVNEIISDIFDHYFQVQNNQILLNKIQLIEFKNISINQINNLNGGNGNGGSSSSSSSSSMSSLNLLSPQAIANKIIKKGTKKWNKITKSLYGNN